MDFEWISTPGRLRSLVRQLEHQPMLAMDTEFLRVDTFYPIPGLVQIADGEQAWLIDPLALSQPIELARIFYAQHIIKVLHACYEDIEVMQQLSRLPVRQIFDTQLAAAYLGYGLQVGYQRLLHEELGIHISKEETRSDWLHRPLSAQQLQYAVQDVRYLLPLYAVLRQRLQNRGHWDKVVEDNQLLLIELTQTTDAQALWRDLPAVWRLSRPQLAVLQALWVWRERQARERNVPRGFLLKNVSLYPLASLQPRDFHQLERIEGMNPRILRREADSLLALIEAARSTPFDDCPETLPRPWPRPIRDIILACREVVAARARDLDLPVDVLIRKRQFDELLEAYVAASEPAQRWRGWRQDVVYRPIVAVFDRHRADLLAWNRERYAS